MESVKYISEEDFHEINRRSKVSKGDILFAMIGTVGNPVIIGDDTDFAIKNLALFKNTFNLNSDYLKFMVAALSKNDIRTEFRRGSKIRIFKVFKGASRSSSTFGRAGTNC